MYHLCHDVNDAIDRKCMQCFKRHTASGRGWDKKTIIQCAKKDRFDLFNHILQERREHINGHPKIPPEVWDYFPSTYELASLTIKHRNPYWNYLVIDYLNEFSNQRKIALFKLAIKAGRQNMCDIIHTQLKPRTTASATQKDMVDFMECAVFSRQIDMIMWVERTFNTSINTPWPPAWRCNGRRLLENILSKHRLYYDQFTTHLETFEYVFGAAEIHNWDECASMILNYQNVNVSDTSELFRKFWIMGGNEHVTPNWKTYCIRYNKFEELGLIHAFCPEWPIGFLDDCETERGARRWTRINLENWALDHGLGRVNVPVHSDQQVSPLHKMMELIEKMKESKMGGYEEGLYLEACNTMKQIHERIKG